MGSIIAFVLALVAVITLVGTGTTTGGQAFLVGAAIAILTYLVDGFLAVGGQRKR